MTSTRSFDIDYDTGSDVLYISRRAGPASRGIEDRSGVIWRYDRDGDLVSATVLDFHERWEQREAELARHLSEKFDISIRQVLDLLNHARHKLAG